MKEEFIKNGLKPLFDKRKNSVEKLLCLDENGYKCVISYHKLKDGRKPLPFSMYNPYTFENIDLFLEKNAKGYLYVGERDVFKSDEKRQWICEKGHEFEMAWRSIKTGRRCPFCFRSFLKNTEIFKKEVFEKVGSEYEVLGEYKKDCVHIDMKHIKCGNEYKVTPSHFLQGRRCPKCSVRYGERNNKYNPNLTAEERVSRRLKERESTNKWRKYIFCRDEFTCQICFSKGGKLNAHHLNGYHWFEEGRFDVNNGVCLCEKCHREFHKEYGNKFNTREQYEEFKQRKEVKI